MKDTTVAKSPPSPSNLDGEKKKKAEDPFDDLQL
jgi:hypothetical protein